MPVRRLLLVLSAFLVACSSDSNSPSANISGSWSFTDNISNSTLGVSCMSQGTAAYTQTGTQVSATATVHAVCTGPGGVADTTGTNTLAGDIDGDNVSFQDSSGCTLEGTVSGSPSNRMSGTEHCTVAISGQNYAFTGTWSSVR